MASIDEAYLDMTRHRAAARPAAARGARRCTKRMKSRDATELLDRDRRRAPGGQNGSDQAKPNGVLWVVPGREAAFLAPLDVRKVPGVGKVTEKNLHALASAKSATWRGWTTHFWRSASASGDWRWRAKRAAWMPAAGSTRKSARKPAPSRSATSTRLTKIPAIAAVLESTLARLSEMVGRRLREHGLHARTVQLKLRYSDFSTITRAHSMERPTQIDTEIFDQARALFRRTGRRGARGAPVGRACFVV